MSSGSDICIAARTHVRYGRVPMRRVVCARGRRTCTSAARRVRMGTPDVYPCGAPCAHGDTGRVPVRRSVCAWGHRTCAHAAWRVRMGTRDVDQCGAACAHADTGAVPVKRGGTHMLASSIHERVMQDVRIIFLGTSSGTPTRDRNVSSVAMVLDGTVLLFDCGEGTQHQLLRAPVRSGAIEAIFITHLHGDHCYGLPGLLATMSLNARAQPLPPSSD